MKARGKAFPASGMLRWHARDNGDQLEFFESRSLPSSTTSVAIGACRQNKLCIWRITLHHDGKAMQSTLTKPSYPHGFIGSSFEEVALVDRSILLRGTTLCACTSQLLVDTPSFVVNHDVDIKRFTSSSDPHRSKQLHAGSHTPATSLARCTEQVAQPNFATTGCNPLVSTYAGCTSTCWMARTSQYKR